MVNVEIPDGLVRSLKGVSLEDFLAEGVLREAVLRIILEADRPSPNEKTDEESMTAALRIDGEIKKSLYERYLKLVAEKA